MSDTSNILITLFSVCSPNLLKLIIIQSFLPVSNTPDKSNPDIKNGSLLMAKNVDVLCWALFQDALLERSTCGKGLRVCLHGGGGPQIGVVTCGGSSHLSCNRDRIKMRYYMDRRVTSPTWGLPPPLVARKNEDSLNTMILDFLVDFKTGESRVF